MTTIVLDTKGLNCPLPVLKAKKAIKDVPQGATLQVQATDPGAVKDFEAFCATTGHEFIGWRDDAGVLIIDIRKRG